MTGWGWRRDCALNDTSYWKIFLRNVLRAAPIWAFNFSQLNARHWKGRCATTALEKECIQFFCCFFQCHSPLPFRRTQGIFQDITWTPFDEWWCWVCKKKKKQHEKGALPELLVEYFLPVLSPTPAQAGLLQQDAHSPINQTQIYRSKAGDSCQKWKRSSKLNSLWKDLKMLTCRPIYVKPKI